MRRRGWRRCCSPQCDRARASASCRPRVVKSTGGKACRTRLTAKPKNDPNNKDERRLQGFFHCRSQRAGPRIHAHAALADPDLCRICGTQLSGNPFVSTVRVASEFTSSQQNTIWFARHNNPNSQCSGCPFALELQMLWSCSERVCKIPVVFPTRRRPSMWRAALAIVVAIMTTSVSTEALAPSSNLGAPTNKIKGLHGISFGARATG